MVGTSGTVFWYSSTLVKCMAIMICGTVHSAGGIGLWVAVGFSRLIPLSHEVPELNGLEVSTYTSQQNI